MHKLKSKWFNKWAKKAKIKDGNLKDAIDEIGVGNTVE